MIEIQPYEKLGWGDFGWLQARYHFSFARYRNPERVGFGPLRVINDDIIKAGNGFAPHSHHDMEIITYVRSGAITHKDSTGNQGRTAAGDIQVMSAGSGIQHSEYNREDVDTTLYQIWITPREKGVDPRWEQRSVPKEPVDGTLPLLVSGREEDRDKDALYIHADAALYGGRIKAGSLITQPVRAQAYLLVSEGEIEIEGQRMKKGDGAQITQTNELSLKAVTEAEVVLIDLPAQH